MSELHDLRLDPLEEDMREIRAVLARLEPVIVNINAQQPHLATKAEIAKLPTRGYLWGVIAAMVGAYTAALAAVAVLLTILPPHHP